MSWRIMLRRRMAAALCAHRLVVVRALGQRRQVGALGQRQVGDRLAEVVVGRRADAVGAVAQPDLVEIELEDLLLGQGLLEPGGEDRLLQLAADRDLVVQEDVLGHLLGDGRAALGPAALQDVEDVLEHRPADAADVDAAMLEEVVVLGRQEGVGSGCGGIWS